MRIFFEFSGGPRDGEVVEGDTATADPAERDIDEGTAFYWETRYGTPGEEFVVMSKESMASYSLQVPGHAHKRVTPAYHLYRVRDQYHDGDEIWITAQNVRAYRTLPADHQKWFWDGLIAKGILEALPAMNPPSIVG